MHIGRKFALLILGPLMLFTSGWAAQSRSDGELLKTREAVWRAWFADDTKTLEELRATGRSGYQLWGGKVERPAGNISRRRTVPIFRRQTCPSGISPYSNSAFGQRRHHLESISR